MGPKLDVNMNPTKGGVTKLPNPQAIKGKEDKSPVISTFVATQEYVAPNCQERAKPIQAVPRYSPYILVPATTQSRIAASTQLTKDIIMMVLGLRKLTAMMDTSLPTINPPL